MNHIIRRYEKSFILNTIMWRFMVAGIAVLFLVSCNNDNDEKEIYDPGKPVELTSFYPDSGRIREMVLLSGNNFGTDPSAIKVFFNSSEAKVINSTGSRILALVPRMPGDTCILSVQVGNQKKEYEQKFRYKIEASVTTIAGNGREAHVFDQGLDKCELKPVYIGADNEYNIFVTDNTDVLLRINTITNTLTVVATKDQGFNHRCQPYANPLTNVLQMGAEMANNRDRFTFLDPRDGWAPKSRFIKAWDLNGCTLPQGGPNNNLNYETHWQCLLCEADGMYYTRYVGGQVVRINPETWEAKIIGMTPIGATYGMAFHPVRKTELWFGYDRADSPTVADAANSLYVWDVTDESTGENNMLSGFRKVSGAVPPMGAHRDGPLDQAQFNSIRMINFDLDGNLYVGDCRNHCIRLVNTTTMMVSTVIGIPGVSSPFKDGAREDATFNTPHGIVTDPDGIIYVADYHNNRVRRIAIE
ncbi:MAG: IPT/TIG domain-containing protein [Bacteroidales bacterium]|nr:IPT/TIG domain-containing protein [Bacteroidales bacterium]